MAAWTPFAICFLLGVSTPVIFVDYLLQRQGDSGTCLTKFILFALASLIVVVLWLGFCSG